MSSEIHRHDRHDLEMQSQHISFDSTKRFRRKATSRWYCMVTLLACQVFCGCQLPLRTDSDLPSPGTDSVNRIPRGQLSGAESLRNQHRIATAVSLMHAGKLPEAQEQLVSIIEANPSDSSAVELLAEVSFKSGDYRLQRASLKRLIDLQPGSATVANRAGKQLLDSVQSEAAQAVMGTTAISFAGSDNTGSEELSTHEVSELALAALERAVMLEPRNTLFAQDLFAVLIGLGENQKAEQVLQQALQKNPTDRILPMTAARLYESRNDWSSAVFYYDVALRNDPTNPVWRRQRAVCHFRQGAYEKARSDFSKALAGSPVKPQLSEHLAWAEAALETEAHGEAQRVLDLIVTRGEYRTADIEVLRGTCLLKQGNVQAASELVLKAQLNWPRHEGLWRLAREIKAIESGPPASDSAGMRDLAGMNS